MRVEAVAVLLDESLRVYITPDLRLRIIVRSQDLIALDALATLAGSRPQTGARSTWGCTKEGTILKVMLRCLPFMVKQAKLASAVIEFLEALTPQDMFSGLLNILHYRRVGWGNVRFD